MSVIIKKDEKIATVVESLSGNYTDDEFIECFKSKYPDDWNRIVREFNAHEQRTKVGKSHPMPNPRQYLINASNVYKKKLNIRN